MPVKEATPRIQESEFAEKNDDEKSTLKLIRRVYTIIFHPFLIRIWECIQDDINKDVKAYICEVSQSLNHHTGNYHTPLSGQPWPKRKCMGSNVRVSPQYQKGCQWCYERDEGESLQTHHQPELDVYATRDETGMYLSSIHCIVATAPGLILSNNVPNLDSAHSIAPDQRKCRKQI